MGLRLALACLKLVCFYLVNNLVISFYKYVFALDWSCCFYCLDCSGWMLVLGIMEGLDLGLDMRFRVWSLGFIMRFVLYICIYYVICNAFDLRVRW
uniref:ORF protein n=1 Tax=Leishmania donovani TaxID=5661 RepID=O03187_LEIDO|nr:ORF [Leishmania donovani]